MVYVTNNNASYSIDVCLICYMHWTYVGVCFIIVFYIYYIFLFFKSTIYYMGCDGRLW